MKSFKKILALGLAAALGTSALSATAAEDFSNVEEIKAIQKSGVLRVGVKNDVVGFSVKDPLKETRIPFSH